MGSLGQFIVWSGTVADLARGSVAPGPGVQPSLSGRDSAYVRAMSAARGIARPDAPEAARDAAYARAVAILDSVEVGGVTTLTRHGRGVAALYQTEARLAAAAQLPRGPARCTAVRRARPLADSLALFFPAGTESPDRGYQALLTRVFHVRDSTIGAADTCG